MRNEDGGASVGELLEAREQLVLGFRVERSGRFIEHHDASLTGNRLGDLDHLALRDTDSVDARRRIDTEAKPVEHIPTFGVRRLG